MVMLSPHEFAAGSVSTAPGDSLSLLLPRSQYEVLALIAGSTGRKVVIFLNDPAQIDGVEWTEEGHDYDGYLVHPVAIELDTDSAFDPRGGGILAGCMIREENQLKLTAGQLGSPFRRVQRYPLLQDLPACGANEAVAFSRWRIVLGLGDDKRELFALDLSERIGERN